MPVIDIQLERAKLVYMSISNKHRWFDKYPDLRESIDKLEYFTKQDRDEIIQGMKDLISNYDNELIANIAIEFPLECKRRWYNTDPYAWLVINSLIYLDEDLITEIIIYLNEIM
jgi:hypothetical protein